MFTNRQETGLWQEQHRTISHSVIKKIINFDYSEKWYANIPFAGYFFNIYDESDKAETYSFELANDAIFQKGAFKSSGRSGYLMHSMM